MTTLNYEDLLKAKRILEDTVCKHIICGVSISSDVKKELIDGTNIQANSPYGAIRGIPCVVDDSKGGRWYRLFYDQDEFNKYCMALEVVSENEWLKPND